MTIPSRAARAINVNEISVFCEHIYEAAEQHSLTLRDVLAKAHSFGITALECDIGRFSSKHEAAALKSLFDSCGMRVSSVYGFFDFAYDDSLISNRKIRFMLETTALLGADKVLCVPGFFRENSDREFVRSRICDMLTVMCEKAAEYGITVTLEDFDDMLSPCRTSEQLLFFLEQCPLLRLTFDTGNFMFSSENALLLYDRLSPYIVHIHCKDRAFTPPDPCGECKLAADGTKMYPAPSCTGDIPLTGILKKAFTSSYNGTLAIEHFGAPDQLEYMKVSARMLKSCLSDYFTD